MDASAIARRLTENPIGNGDGFLVPCPAHDDRKPSLSIRDGKDGRLLVKCFAGCDFARIRDALKARNLWPKGRSGPYVPPDTGKPIDRTDLLDRIWAEGVLLYELSWTVIPYLKTRGISFPDPNHWYHPTGWPLDLLEHRKLEVYENRRPTGQFFPAMLAAIRNPDGIPVGIHITLLLYGGEGKAPVENQRRMIGVKPEATKGGAVRLFDPVDGVVALAEGIETALSAYIVTGTPCWAALSAGGIERVVLPKDIRKADIFADNDSAGLAAASTACLRFRKEGRESEILVPNEPGWDFNDVLTNKNARPAGN